jgi:hypothetical protein
MPENELRIKFAICISHFGQKTPVSCEEADQNSKSSYGRRRPSFSGEIPAYHVFLLRYLSTSRTVSLSDNCYEALNFQNVSTIQSTKQHLYQTSRNDERPAPIMSPNTAFLVIDIHEINFNISSLWSQYWKHSTRIELRTIADHGTCQVYRYVSNTDKFN